MLFLKTFGISLLISLYGFKKFIYIISICYGLSVAIIGAFLLFISTNLTIPELILGFLYIAYGLRLSLFLLIREYKHKSYIKRVGNEINTTEKNMKFIIKLFIWISVSLLYGCQTSPLTFRTISNNKNDNLVYIGIAIILFGFLLEIKADNEKSNAKKINPNRFVDSGLYKIVRCPNYFGEVIFWTGNYIGGIKIYNGGFQWLISTFGYFLIIYIMFSGARRIEIRQNKEYGKDPVYQKYIKKTPILIPFIPLYSVEKYYWLRG